MSVNRLRLLAIGTLLLLSATLLAQHGGHGGGGGRRGAPGAASGDTSDAGLADFNRALAVQATSDQVSHFPGLTKNTEAARNLAKDFSGMSGKADSSNDFFHRTAALKEAVEEAQGSNQDFVKSFTKSQKAGLKELTKKLRRRIRRSRDSGKTWRSRLEERRPLVKAWPERLTSWKRRWRSFKLSRLS